MTPYRSSVDPASRWIVTPYRSSASQVSTFELCPRKWAFLKIEKLEDPPSRFAQFGTETHAHLEEWFKFNHLPPETKTGRCARAILRHLPPPQTPGIDIEHEIDVEIGGVPFKGFIDVRMLKRDPRPLVSDHKTTGDLKWALAPEDLPNDVQATIYAHATMLDDRRQLDAVDLQWDYGTRDRARSLAVVRTVTRADITPRLERTAESVQVMRELYEQQTPALDIEPDARGCEAYGGCPFRDRCNLTPQERMRSIMSQETQSAFLAKLKAQKGNGAAARRDVGQINPPEAPKKKRGRPKKKADPVVEAKPEPEPEPVVEAKPEPEPDPVVEAKPEKQHYSINDLKLLISFFEVEAMLPDDPGPSIFAAWDRMQHSAFFAGYRAGLEAAKNA